MSANKINNITANMLKNARIKAGYSNAREFAEKHNLPVATYYQHESGKRCPKLKILHKYCTLLNLNIDLLTNTLSTQNRTISLWENKDRNLLKKRLIMSVNSGLPITNKTEQRKKLIERIENEFSKILDNNNIVLSGNKFSKSCEYICEHLMRCINTHAYQKKILDIVFHLLESLLQDNKKLIVKGKKT